MSKFLKGAVLAIVAVLAVSPAIAQETTGGIVGNVTNDVGTPIAGALINAQGPFGPQSTVTDDTGAGVDAIRRTKRTTTRPATPPISTVSTSTLRRRRPRPASFTCAANHAGSIVSRTIRGA